MSDQRITDSLIDPTRIDPPLSDETRDFMAQMVQFIESPAPRPSKPAPLSSVPQQAAPLLSAPLTALGPAATPPGIPPHLSSLIPALIGLMGRLLEELESNLPKLLSLNPSRRQSIAHYLERLAGTQVSASQQLDPALKLGRWIEGPRSPAQNSALQTYLEELAILSLGQAILLKNWSDRGIRKWSAPDLGRLNWVLSTTLKPLLPLDREGWHLTRPNLYSWYNPSPLIQHEIWKSLDFWRLGGEGPTFLSHLLSPIRRAQPESPEARGYDSRFYQTLWQQIPHFGFDHRPDTSGLKRGKSVFSPTLRDGSLVRSGPPALAWVGLEASPFQLMLAELMQLWWGPTPPPLWSMGTGLEVHNRDQLTFALSSPKPSIVSRIAEMEACEMAFVLEEQTVRSQGRSVHSMALKEQLEGLPYFKKLRATGTSLGDFQACVALTKVRPGGLFWWAREEPLSSRDGQSVLNFLLDRAKLMSEWDFSELEHSLPAALSLYPKHLYLFQKETNIETRLSHRPTRHSVQGLLRSHVELPQLLTEALQAGLQQPPHSLSKGQWRIMTHTSPFPQRDWLENWPDPTSQAVILRLDELRSASSPLANFTTIRHTPEGDSNQNGGWTVHHSMKGLWVSAESDTHGRRLRVRPLPRSGEVVHGTGYLVLLSDENWMAPISTYLMSETVHQWLDQNAERRGERWILNEQMIKWIPTPKRLLQELRVPGNTDEVDPSCVALPLPGDWESLATEVSHHPTLIKEELDRLSHENEATPQIHVAIFVRAARALEHIRSTQSRLLSMVDAEGCVNWKDLLETLPKNECVLPTVHPRVRLSGSLPPHLPIDRIDRVKTPVPGILLSTESGFSLHIASEVPLFLTMLWDQMDGLNHPTWTELMNYLRLPRKVELAESTALEILRSHGEQIGIIHGLTELIQSCQLF